MADAKISALTMVSAPELQDLLPLVDVNDATDAATGTTKQSLLSYLLAMAGMPFQGRLSLESGVAVSSTDQVAKSTLYLLPWHGNRLTLPTISGSDLRWVMLKVNTVGFPLSGLTSGKPYDVFCFTTTATPSSTNTTTDIITFGSAQGWATGSNVTVTTTGGGLTAGTAYFWNAAVFVQFASGERFTYSEPQAYYYLSEAPPPTTKLADLSPGDRFIIWDANAAEARIMLVTDQWRPSDDLRLCVDVQDGTGLYPSDFFPESCWPYEGSVDKA
jgi:hypothetical protein